MRGVEQIPWLYDLVMAFAERGQLGRWRGWLARDAGGRVLEVGCGTGRNLPGGGAFGAVARFASEPPASPTSTSGAPPPTPRPPRGLLVGVDPHPQNVARARRRAPSRPLVQARAEALPFRDGAFEVVVSSLVLCSVDDPSRALAEIRRVLAPGGELRAIEHVRARRGWLARLQDLAQPTWTRLTGGCHPNRDTEHAVAAAGFHIEERGRRASGLMRRFVARIS